MITDFIIKPLQGSPFGELQDVVLVYKHITTLDSMSVGSPSQEYVRDKICKGTDYG